MERKPKMMNMNADPEIKSQAVEETTQKGKKKGLKSGGESNVKSGGGVIKSPERQASGSFSEFLHGETNPYYNGYQGSESRGGEEPRGETSGNMSQNNTVDDYDNSVEAQMNSNRSFWDEYDEEAFNVNEVHSVDNLLAAYNPQFSCIAMQSRMMYDLSKLNGAFMVEGSAGQNYRNNGMTFDTYPFYTGLPMLPPNLTRMPEAEDKESKDLNRFYQPTMIPFMRHRSYPSAYVKLKEINSVVAGEADMLPHVTIRGREAIELDEALMKRSKKTAGKVKRAKQGDAEASIMPKRILTADGNMQLMGTLSGGAYAISGESASTKPKAKRQKHVCRACVHCKRAHLACDNERPCRRCVHLGKADCVDVEHKRRGRPKSSPEKKMAQQAKGASFMVHPSTMSQLCTDIFRPLINREEKRYEEFYETTPMKGTI